MRKYIILPVVGARAAPPQGGGHILNKVEMPPDTARTEGGVNARDAGGA